MFATYLQLLSIGQIYAGSDEWNIDREDVEKATLPGCAQDVRLPTLHCRMGQWDYFVSRMRLDDVAQRFQMAKEKLKNPERYDEWLQREVNPKRAAQIANYLENQPERFFSSLVVTVYGGAPQWFALGLSETDQLSFEDMGPLSVSISEFFGCAST